MHRIAKFRRLGAGERKLVLQALVLLPMTALGLRILGLRRVQALMRADSRLDAGPACGDERAEIDRVTRLVMIVARHGPYRASCLPLSLALQRLLRGRGIHAEMHLGVRKLAGRLEAHAWLEWQGLPIMERGDVRERFAAFEDAVAPRTGVSR